MYLTELYRFYERMTQDPQSGMPPEGMSAEAIHFALVIGEDGSLKGVHDLRDSKGKPLRRFVPAAVKRTATKALPNLIARAKNRGPGAGYFGRQGIAQYARELQKRAEARFFYARGQTLSRYVTRSSASFFPMRGPTWPATRSHHRFL